MQVVPLPVASYNLMPAPRYWARGNRAYDHQHVGQDGNSARRYKYQSTVNEQSPTPGLSTPCKLKLDAEPRPPVTTNPTLWKDTFNRRSGTHARISQKSRLPHLPPPC